MNLRQMAAADLPALARLAAEQQSDPARHVIYLATDERTLLTELEESSWTEVGVVAESDDEPVAWLVGDVDEEMGRVWWLGPFVDSRVDEWAGTADALLLEARRLLPRAVTQEEMAFDERATDVIVWATGRGLVREVASDVIVLDRDRAVAPPSESLVRDLTAADHVKVIELHDQSFPGTHTTGRGLVTSTDERHRRLVADLDGAVAGYVAVELQADDTGYIDYVAVAPEARRRGIGRDLVAGGVAELRRLGAGEIALTVRGDAIGARELYASLGFTIERTVVPLRLGFSL